jgi:protocadherin-16/23
VDSYELLVEALDQGSPQRSAQAVVKITVDDVNDEAPRLAVPANQVIYVARTSASSSLAIGRIVGADNDSNDRVTYELTNAGNDAAVTIDRWTGELRLAKKDASNITISVKLSDSARPSPNSITEDISIFFVDENSNELLSRSTHEIRINEQQTPVGSSIGSLLPLTTSKRDRYLFSFDNSVAVPFYINSATGEIFLTAKLNATLTRVFEVDATIASISGSTSPISAKVVIKVVRDSSNPRPQFDQDPVKVEVPENVPVGQVIHTLVPTSVHTNGLSFAMLEQLPNDAFVIEDRSGTIKLAKQLDFERDQNYVLTVRVTESSTQLSTFVTVVVSVLDTNDNQPLIVSGDVLHLSPDTLFDVPITRIVAIDKDVGVNGELAYSILSGNDDGVFKLEPGSGDLSLVKPALRDYYLRVRAQDAGSPRLFSDKELHVKVTSSLMSHPKFVQPTFNLNIQENLPPGSPLSTLDSINTNSGDLQYNLLVGSDKFSLDSRSGQLRAHTPLDREDQGKYSLVVSVADQRYPDLSDTAVVNVNVVDVNDNDPTFGASCRDLNIPENSKHSYIHTLVASDRDVGDNGKLSYKFASPGSPFSLDTESGRISAPPLDRETQSTYRLEIIAQDSGSDQVRRSASCIITVNIQDTNDNSPSFSQSIYSASVKEDVPRGTEVLQVLATDPDEGVNAAVEYSIENATFSAFSIDKSTGVIFTSELLDRETIDEFTFGLLAVDGGAGMVKSSRAIVTITITDANDHTPQFDEFPFRINMTATPPVGVPMLRLSASDPDLGAHSQLTFKLVRPEQRALFELSATEGLLTIKDQVTWSPGTIQTLEVSVSDAGRPPRSSTGLVEVFIEGGPAVTLTFQQDTYHTELTENPISGEDVAQVRSVRSDGRRQRVIYTFLRGNEDGAFEINSNNGLIRVRDPEVIDYELHKQFILTIQGQGLGAEDDLNAYTTCIVAIKDRNDNLPQFNQNLYKARVQEGLRKNSLVTTVKAFDLDSDDITYEIIAGNVDDAFFMGTAQPGVILTNTVLDREIRDKYQLTVAAKDNGQPSLTGSCIVVIDILDDNDSPLQFPVFPPFRVSGDLPAGSLIATVRANDIDLASEIIYSLKAGNSGKVALATYTGQVYLLQSPSQWDTNEITVVVEAFDGLYKAEQEVTIFYDKAAKDCRPLFDLPLYKFQVAWNASFPVGVGDVKATSCSNEVIYSVTSGLASVVASNGTVVLNQGMETNSTKIIAQAKDRRSKLTTTAVVVIDVKATLEEPLEFALDTDTFEVGQADEILKLKLKNNQDNVVFNITTNDHIGIDPTRGILFRLNNAGVVGSESLEVSVRRLNERPEEATKKTLRFFWTSSKTSSVLMAKSRQVHLPINSPLNSKVNLCDPSGGRTSSITQILSGNDDNLFTLDKQVLVLVKRPLESQDVNVVIRSGSLSDLSICTVQVNFFNDVSDSASDQVFILDDIVTSVAENAPSGAFVLRPPMLPNIDDDVRFFSNNDSMFRVNPNTGDITTKTILNYEAANNHAMQVIAKDTNNHQFVCNVQILVESRDEFAPIFTQDVYTFNIPANANSGAKLGSVRANDGDSGPDGYVTYSISPIHQYFDIDPVTGQITVRRSLDTGVLQENDQVRRRRRSLQELHLRILAKSKKPDSLTSSSKVVLYLQDDLLPIASSTEVPGGVAPWLQGVLVGLALVLTLLAVGALLHCRRVRDAIAAQKIALLPNPPGGHLNTSSNYSADQTLEMVGNATRYPPQYSEIMSDYERTTATSVAKRSELSEKSHRSASSGRGSVEDVEEDADVEIRMINEGNNAGSWTAGHNYEADDQLSSQGSVQNTEEYLARLGIDIRKPPNVKLNISDDPYAASAAGGSIYNRIPEDAMSEANSTISAAKPHSLLYGSTGRQLSMTGSLSSIVHSEEELAGSYNWDYLLDWCPQYQNLAHVFKEISKLKDEDESGSKSVMLPSFGKTLRLAPVRPSQSPIAHDSMMLSQNALSPSFHPSLSPLATKSPSVSPMAVPLKRELGPPRIVGRGPLH